MATHAKNQARHVKNVKKEKKYLIQNTEKMSVLEH